MNPEPDAQVLAESFVIVQSDTPNVIVKFPPPDRPCIALGAATIWDGFAPKSDCPNPDG